MFGVRKSMGHYKSTNRRNDLRTDRTNFFTGTASSFTFDDDQKSIERVESTLINPETNRSVNSGMVSLVKERQEN